MEVFIGIIIALIVIIAISKKKKTGKKTTAVTVKMQGRTVSETPPEYEQANVLIKQASSLRKDDISLAIDKIKEALLICPDFYGGHIKLVKYQIAAGRENEAKQVIKSKLSNYRKDSFKHSDIIGRAEWINLQYKANGKDNQSMVLSYLFDVYFNIIVSALNKDNKNIDTEIIDFKAGNHSRNFKNALLKTSNRQAVLNTFSDYLEHNKANFLKLTREVEESNFEKFIKENINPLL